MSDLATARATWLAELEAAPRLPERTVIVRTESVAHCWRRDLARSGRSDLLTGTRFVTPLGAAAAVLEGAGVTFQVGEERVRAARIASLVSEPLPLQGFDLSVLRERPGWEHALSLTLGDIEAACLDLERLRAASDPRCHDLALLLGRLNELAGASWTTSRALREATALVQADLRAWPFGGSCLAEVTGHETAAMAHWLGAIPNSKLVCPAVQPRRTVYTERAAALLPRLESRELENAQRTERDLLAKYLFAPPALLTDRARPRSEGEDGTVQIELHSGLEEELAAAVGWVLGEVAEHATPLEQIAIVVPQLDPYAGMLSARFAVLGEDGLHMVGGLPATETFAGARVASVLRALSGYLHVDTLADVVPNFKLASDDGHLSRRDALSALYQLGTAGGSAAHPAGARDWAQRNAARQVTLAAAIADKRRGVDEERELRELTRALEHLKGIAPALDALDRVAQLVLEQGALSDLWTALSDFFRDHVRLGVEGSRILFALDAALTPLIEADVVAGEAALEGIASALQSIRFPEGRFGEPRVTIVALNDAVGLSFRCVRVMGLAEGMVPSNVREDPALPDAVRTTLGHELPLADSRAIAQLHALHRVVASTSDRIVLSASRMDSEGRYREPSGVLLEAAAAVGRPPLGRGKKTIPDAKLMRRTQFEPARTTLLKTRSRWTILEADVLERAASTRQVPMRWQGDALLDLGRLTRGASSNPDAMDGWVPEGPFVALPGLTPEMPISASALSRLLECPHRFLFERVLGWAAPPDLIDEGEIDALSYGSLFHETAEAFYREHGTAFCSRHDTLDAWKVVADQIAATRFEAFLETYPLVGAGVRSAQRARLRRDLHSLLESDWGQVKTFVDVERAFGPMALDLSGQPVHVRGYIDRLDIIGEATLVRDLKTGRAKPRLKETELMPAYDVQLGLYGLVVRSNATAWSMPATIQGAYVYPADPSGDDRAFESDFATLATKTEHWITTGIGLLQARRFPRTPVADDCRFCPFKAVCGESASERAAELLSGSDGSVGAFAAIKLGEVDA